MAKKVKKKLAEDASASSGSYASHLVGVRVKNDRYDKLEAVAKRMADKLPYGTFTVSDLIRKLIDDFLEKQ